MDDLNDILKPVWSVQKDIDALWHAITLEEQQIIQSRMDDLFKNGLPFVLKHEKIIYIHIFLALAQIDVIACQVPLKFQSDMVTPLFKEQLRAQLLDEIFHVMLSIKIVYMLSTPYYFPPEVTDNTQQFCEFIRREPCTKISIIFLNLISEGIAEELAHCFHRHHVAHEVFDIILKDERRHVSDADLYFAIGLPDQAILRQKLEDFEDHVLSSLIFQYNTTMSLMTVLGMEGMRNFIDQVDSKYKEQLNKLNLVPGKKWSSVMHFFAKTLAHFKLNSSPFFEVAMSPLRQLSMTQWAKPSDPTMVGQFNIDVTSLDFFEKKYPSDTLTTLMLQTISQVLAEYPEYSLFIHDNRLYKREKSHVCLVVKLPNCGDHMGIITFQDCHTLSAQALSSRIRQVVSMMTFCYKKREQLEIKYPELKGIQNNIIHEMNDPVFRPILPIIPGVSLSNIGSFGYTQSKSPLLANEAAKVTIMSVQRTPVWCKKTKTFIPRDLLPVSVSTDHRIFGGNMPLPKIMDDTFQAVFKTFELNPNSSFNKLMQTVGRWETTFNDQLFIKKIDALLLNNLQFGYMILITLQTMWPDYLSIEDIFENSKTKTSQSIA